MNYSLSTTLMLVLLQALRFTGTVPSAGVFEQALIRSLTRQHVVVVPIDALGLANRLRIVGSMYALLMNLDANQRSEKSFQLILIWKESYDCPIRSKELFSSHKDDRVVFLDYSDVAGSDLEGLSFELSIRRRMNELVDFLRERIGEIDYMELFPKRFLLEEAFLSSASAAERVKVSVVWTRGVHSLRNMDCRDYIFAKSLFYQGLVAVDSIQSIVDDVKYNHFAKGGAVIGIHVRAFDSDFDWAVVSPDGSGSHSSGSSRFDEASPVDSFLCIMKAILLLSPSVKFFVASNSILAKRELLSHFPLSVISISGLDNSSESSNRSTKIGILFALAEFLLLGEAGLVIHSRGSSFARESAFKYMRRVVDVAYFPTAESRLAPFLYFYSTNMDLPDCGMPEYIRERAALASGRESVVCYLEEGGRRMCTVKYRVCPAAVTALFSSSWERSYVYSFSPNDIDELEQTSETGSKRTDMCIYVTAESNGYSL